ncbi:MAG: HD domain-containing phosphohydrolase [Syntrophomonadaceae bacterium]
MQAKHVILLGIIISALLATLVIFEWIPPQVAGFIMLGITLTAAFFIALSMLRGRRLGDQELVATAIQRIHEQKSEEQVLTQMLHWSKAIVESQSSFYFNIEQGTSLYLSEKEEEGAWRAISEEVAESGKNWLWPNASGQACPPISVKTFLAMPLTGENNKILGILYLVNRQGEPAFKAADASLLQPLMTAGRTALLRLRREEKNLSFYRQIIAAVVGGIEAGSPGFQGHARRVSRLAGLLGKVLGFNSTEIRELTTAALLHDVGKIVPDEIPEAETTPAEDRHPEKGAGLLPAEESFTSMREAILYHHERYNGSGFPEGLRMADIPLGAGIIAVADVFDALTCLNKEEARMSSEQALAVIKKATGTLFDPMVVVALEETMPALLSEEKQRIY